MTAHQPTSPMAAWGGLLPFAVPAWGMVAPAVWTTLLLIIKAGAALLFARTAYEGIRHGRSSIVQFGDRASQPIMFWLGISAFLLGACLCVATVIATLAQLF